VKIALFGRTADLFPAGGARNIADSRRESGKNRIQPLDDLDFAANHHAITSLQTPDSSAGSHIDVVNLARSEFICPPDVIDVIRVPAVNEYVALLEMR